MDTDTSALFTNSQEQKNTCIRKDRSSLRSRRGLANEPVRLDSINATHEPGGDGVTGFGCSLDIASPQEDPVDDLVISVFVIAFDVKSGNIIEWSRPEVLDLGGVEFKALVSGAHLVQTDFVYFRHLSYFGLACYGQRRLDSEEDEGERGIRIKSVGILTHSYSTLHRHMSFLNRQVKRLLAHPGDYVQLEAFYEDNESMMQMSTSQSSMSSSTSSLLPSLKITHPAGCFEQFINFFGERIFTLWRYALLQKRILFYSPPPIGVVCYRVYCCCSLANHNVPQFGFWKPKPFFYTNVADTEDLAQESSYIACTTEKVFETKSHLYDVYVDNQNILPKGPAMGHLLVISDTDRVKLEQLKNSRFSQIFSEGVDGEDSADEVFLSFFREYNTRLFDTLLDVSQTQERFVTPDHMQRMGLDPRQDRIFLIDLIELYGIDVILMMDNPCCPT